MTRLSCDLWYKFVESFFLDAIFQLSAITRMDESRKDERRKWNSVESGNNESWQIQTSDVLKEERRQVDVHNSPIVVVLLCYVFQFTFCLCFSNVGFTSSRKPALFRHLHKTRKCSQHCRQMWPMLSMFKKPCRRKKYRHRQQSLKLRHKTSNFHWNKIKIKNFTLVASAFTRVDFFSCLRVQIYLS